jgi:hypothetical protein
MLTNTKIILAAALLFTATSVVLANEIDESVSTAQAEREWQDYLNSTRTGSGGRGAFAYALSQQETSGPQKHYRSR